jgi:uncharacterized protein (TIRG00374 family)
MNFDGARVGTPAGWVRLLVSGFWVALALTLAYLATFVDWAGVYARARGADPLWLALAVCGTLVALPFWSLSWVLLSHSRLRRIYQLMEVQAITLAAVQSLSLLAGGATAMVMLTRRAGFSPPAALSLLALDQLVTGIVKVILVALAVSLAQPPAWMQHAGWSLLAVVAVAVAVLLMTHGHEASLLRWSAERSGALAKVVSFVGRASSHLRALRDPLRSFAAVVLMLVRRLLEGLPILCVQKAVGIPVSWELGLLVLTALALVTVIPQPPGNAGLYEAAVLVVYQAAGIPADLALAAALLQHAAFLVAALVPGYLVLAIRRPWRRRLTT